MFAGRYVWWLLTSATLLLLALIGFDYVAILIVSISDCASREGTCYTMNYWLMDTVKPLLVVAPAILLTLVVLIRILYLRFMPLWILPVLVWVGSTGGALYAYGPLWHEGADYTRLAMLLPPGTFAFLALSLFLAFPLEDEDMPQDGGAAPIGILAGFMAFMCMVHAFATSTSMAQHVARLFNAPDLAGSVEQVRALMATFLLVADGNPIPGYLMVILFALALALRILRHERIISGEI